MISNSDFPSLELVIFLLIRPDNFGDKFYTEKAWEKPDKTHFHFTDLGLENSSDNQENYLLNKAKVSI